jgi:hypothetical protein
MSQISIKGEDGKPVRFAYLDGDNLRLQFEYYARDADEGDYEVIQTVLAEDFASIAIQFGLDPKQNILEILQQISDSLRGQELVDALDSKEIKCEVFTWGS